jgi:uncharacterized protein YegJ (DUF2314 family)
MTNKLLENVEYLCGDCLREQRDQWQAENYDLEILPGMYVKLSFTDESLTDQINTEWMWIRVTEVSECQMVGILDNNPEFVKNITFGETVFFTRDQIASHWVQEP